MLNRKYNLKLDLQFRCNNSNMEFNQFDKNTSDFFMQINRSGKEIDLSKVLVTLVVIKPNGGVDSQFLEVEENGVHANLKPSLKDIAGDYQCKAILTLKDETVVVDQVFTYTVNEDKFLTAFNQVMPSDENYTLLTDILGRLSTIETDEEQRQINEAERILNEEQRQVEEGKRVRNELIREHNDADREKAEAIRESNENDRKEAEILRKEAETLRVEAEKTRVNTENLRVEAEKLRNDNYDFMTSDEERRRSEEDSRIEAENLRKQAETTRVNAESQRRTTEKARDLKENERNSKELERETNEIERKSNESERVQAETERTSRYNNFITDAENAANDFKSYADTAKQEEAARKANELDRVETEDRRVSNEVTRISNENARKDSENRRIEAETNRQSKFNSKISEVNNKVVEVNVAKDTVIADTKEAITTMKEDVASAIAAGTNDLEVKEARKDLNGKTHESLKLRIESDFEGLKESQDMAYSSDNIANYSGSVVCKETKNGTVKDLRISGRSLVNLSSVKDMEVVGTGSGSQSSINKLIKPLNKDSVYTIVIKVPTSLQDANCMLSAYDANGNGRIQLFSGAELFNAKGTTLVKSFKLLSNSDVDVVTIRLIVNNTSNTYTLNDVVILEGDHTQNPPTAHFEGVASVGNGVDEIEVSSLWTNGNLVDNDKIFKDANFDNVNGDEIRKLHTKGLYDIFDDNSRYIVDYNVDVIEGSNTTFAVMHYNDGTVAYVTNTTKPYTSVKPVKRIMWTYGNNCKVKNAELIVNKAGVEKINIHKSDKKPILFKDTDGNWKPVKELRGLGTVCDTIELHSDGKYYYHIRTVKSVLNGTSNYSDVTMHDELSGTSKYMVFKDVKIKSNHVISDKFLAIKDMATFKAYDGECCFINNYGLSFKVLKSSLITQDDVGFKKFLQSNNVLIVHDLAEEKVFEVNPLFLEAFEGETMMSINSGVVNAPMGFKLTSSLPNLTRNLQLRIDNLESEIYKSQELQNIMLLENDLRLMDLEFALLESMPIKLNLRSDVMFARGVTEFEFLKGRILSGSHTDEYLEKCINKYKKAGRLTDEEYDILYDMIYPPVYDVLAEK